MGSKEVLKTVGKVRKGLAHPHRNKSSLGFSAGAICAALVHGSTGWRGGVSHRSAKWSQLSCTCGANLDHRLMELSLHSNQPIPRPVPTIHSWIDCVFNWFFTWALTKWTLLKRSANQFSSHGVWSLDRNSLRTSVGYILPETVFHKIFRWKTSTHALAILRTSVVL